MVRKLKILLAVFVLGGFFPSLGFGEYAGYASLAAKYVYIKGPSNYKEIGLALSEAACDRLIAVLDLADKFEFNQALEAYDILRIKNNTPALVLDLDLFEGKAKVTVFKGLQRPFSGWIPIEWLRDNQNQPVFSNSYQFVPYQFSEDSLIYELTWGYK